MSKLKLFIENFFIYGVGGIINKIIPLIMLPIITKLMPNTAYFGISDLSNTIVSFGSSIAILGMYDAMYRFFFDKDDERYKKSICSTTLLITTTISLFVFITMLEERNTLSQIFFGSKEYAYVICICAGTVFTTATNGIISAPTRMQNKRKVYLITNVISSILAYTVSIPLILGGYYIIALPIASMISGIVMGLIFAILNHEWFSIKLFDKRLLRPLFQFAIPTVPSFLIFWVFNSCDKIMITNFIGIGEAGIYSVSAKMGHASQLIYTAFAGGWQYFVFSTMYEENQIKTNSRIFEYLGLISFVATMLLCAFSYRIFMIIFPKEYLSGYIAAPYLFLAPLLQMLFQVISSQFSVIKKTGPSMLFLSVGAVINLIANSKLIPVIGIEGAAIATLLGYVVAVVICSIVLMKMNRIILTKRFLVSTLIMFMYMIMWRIFFSDKLIIGICISFFSITIYLYFYRYETKQIKELLIKMNIIDKSL